MTDRPAFIRWFPASAQSYVEHEIGTLIDAVPDQPEFAHDRLRTGECFVIVCLTSTHPRGTDHGRD